jgi:hypothetical protein
MQSSVADPDPGSRIRCLFDPWIWDQGSGLCFFPDPESQTHIFESFLGKKFYIALKIGPHFFLQHFKNKIIYNFVKFVATEKGMTTNFFSPLSFVAVFGSGIQDG